MTVQPDWGRVLEYMYHHQMGELDISLRKNNSVQLSPHSDIVREIDLDEREIRRALEFMIRSGLVGARSVGNRLKLTPKGFEVAHERDLRQRQQRLAENQASATKTLADFTILLGAAALIQALTAVVTAEKYTVLLATSYVLLLIAIWYKRSGWNQGLENGFV